ncbi:MAG: hypothetical protein MUE81_01135 [Thermoflexibacter sp.]|jgi:hypothetical protein|nr:hypothetical protein [Thermoflexibacter sp.]
MEKLTDKQQYFRNIIDLVLDGEGDKNEVDFCMNQVAHCPYCRTTYEQEKAVRECIKRYENYVTAPQDLLLSIQSITQQAVYS